VIVAALLLAAPPAMGAPQVLSVELIPPPVVGRKTNLTVRATDPQAAISGLVVLFGKDESVYGLSACRMPGAGGEPLPAAFAPGSTVRLTVPHTFTTTGPQPVLTTVASGGCSLLADRVVQQTVVTPTRPGARSAPIVPGPQLPLPLPQPPPGLSASPAAAHGPNLSRHLRRCRGAHRRVGRSPAALRRARRSLRCLHNAIRGAHHLPPLRENKRLRRAARDHSRAMIRLGFFAHVQPGGLDLVDRITRAGYARNRALTTAGGYVVGENISFGNGRHSTPLATIRAWMASSGHRANILERRFRDVGLGLARGTPGRPRDSGMTYTVDFGVRR
jgi:uncharacterized protein YkwD